MQFLEFYRGAKKRLGDIQTRHEKTTGAIRVKFAPLYTLSKCLIVGRLLRVQLY